MESSDLLHIAPSFFAFFLYLFDEFSSLSEEFFFIKTKKTAMINIAAKIDEELPLQPEDKSKVANVIQSWHFNCFRTSIFGVQQLQFLELMLVQCVIFWIIWLNDSHNAVWVAGTLGLVFLCLYIATFFQHENFTWFHPRHPKSSSDKRDKKKSPHLVRRLVTIIFTATMLAAGKIIADGLTEAFMAIKMFDLSPMVIIFLVAVFFAFVIVLINHRTKKQGFIKNQEQANNKDTSGNDSDLPH